MINSTQDSFYIKSYLRRRLGAGTYSLLDTFSKTIYNQSFHELLRTNSVKAVKVASMLNNYVAEFIEKNLPKKRLGHQMPKERKTLQEYT